MDNINNNIFFIGGVSCSGKTTLSNMLAEKYDMHLYRCDKFFHIRKRNTDAHISPTIFNLTERGMINVLINDNIEKQFNDYMHFLEEDFSLIIHDLYNITTTKPILVEGNQILPHMLHSLLPNFKNAVWIIPDEILLETNFNKRKTLNANLASSSNPSLGKKNWIARNIMLIDYIKKYTIKNSLNLLTISSDSNIDDNLSKLESLLNLNAINSRSVM